MADPVLSDIGGLPHAVAVFDKDGDMDGGERSALLDAMAGAYAGQGPTDLIVFSHCGDRRRTRERLFPGEGILHQRAVTTTPLCFLTRD